jgi:long-subunit acyl-CoA synthetase (AMP-forming)
MILLERIRLHADESPTAAALTWQGGSLSYAQLFAEIETASTLLVERGVRMLALDLENGPDWINFDIAALALGICVVPLPGFFSAEQLRYAIEQAGVEAVVTDDLTRLRERAGDLLEPGEAVLSLGGREAFWLATSDNVRCGTAIVAAGVHKITFTSGTTGEPKGVPLGWSQMQTVAMDLAEAVQLGPGDIHQALMPLAVLLENIGGVYAPLCAGATVSLSPMTDVGMTGSSLVDGARMARALHEAEATTAILTPQTLQALVEAIEHGCSPPDALRFAAVGGAPVSPRLLQRALAVGLPVFEGYGLSECSSVVCLNTPAANRPGSVGRPLPHSAVTIATDGEVVVQTSGFAGYLGEAVSSAGAWPTGDLGELDDDGFLHLRGRRRHVFITAYGRNVSPEWVERELTLEPSIAQAVVFGEARPFNVAIIVRAAGAADKDIEQAIDGVNHALPDYARVSRWIVAESAFAPKNGMLTGTGRLRRDAIAVHYRDIIDSLYIEAQTS